LRAALAEHHRRFPDVDVHSVDGGYDKLFCDLITNTIDVAIMTAGGLSWDDCGLALWSERVIVARADLSNERMLVPQRGPGPELAASQVYLKYSRLLSGCWRAALFSVSQRYVFHQFVR